MATVSAHAVTQNNICSMAALQIKRTACGLYCHRY